MYIYLTRAISGLVSQPIDPKDCDLDTLHDTKNNLDSTLSRPARLIWEIPETLTRCINVAHKKVLQVYKGSKVKVLLTLSNCMS